MADLSVTAASVANIDANTATGTAGASVTAGQTVYLDSATSTLKLADANLSAAAAATVGIAMHGSLSGQPLTYALGNTGSINVGATLVVGVTYVQSAAAGGIAPTTDLVTGWNVVRLGYATAAGVLKMDMKNYGVAVP